MGARDKTTGAISLGLEAVLFVAGAALRDTCDSRRSNMPTRIRKAKVRDLPLVYASELAYIREIEPEQESRWKNAIHGLLTQWTTNLDKTFVLERDGRPIGHCFWEVHGAEAVLASIYVIPEERRKGLGLRLLRRLQADAARRGFAKLTLGVHKGNPARHLYDAAGFRHTHDKADYRYYEKTVEGPAAP